MANFLSHTHPLPQPPSPTPLPLSSALLCSSFTGLARRVSIYLDRSKQGGECCCYLLSAVADVLLCTAGPLACLVLVLYFDTLHNPTTTLIPSLSRKLSHQLLHIFFSKTLSSLLAFLQSYDLVDAFGK